ncbi:hypothetical protein lerEdw1_019808 [Lerista edwardsae]|nr:hypothetical protein lerEdw1_019808 [Lerista edwardsae]
MARVPDVLLTGCREEEDDAEAPWRNEVSFYPSTGPFSALKTARPGGAAAPRPDLELSRWGGLDKSSRPFADSDLLQMLHSNHVEASATFARAALLSGAGAVEYRFDPPPRRSTVQDVDHKSLFLGRVRNEDRLFAGHVEAVNSEKLVLNFYNSWDSKGRLTRLVALGIGALYLSCRQKGGRPQLQLEKLETPLKPTLGKDMARILFKFQSTTSGYSFESAAYLGWFLATADAESEPVRLHNLVGHEFYTDFYLPELEASSRL